MAAARQSVDDAPVLSAELRKLANIECANKQKSNVCIGIPVSGSQTQSNLSRRKDKRLQFNNES